jgi:uncharacterized protein YbbC (DUF1343 family)
MQERKDNKVSVQLPIDNLRNLWPKALQKVTIGAVLHPASISATQVHSSTILRSLESESLFSIGAWFGPQHGILGQTQDNMIEWEGHPEEGTGTPIYSLYGEHREPTEQMLEGLEALLVDLQDVGARYYTFIWTLYLCMKACEQKGIPIVVCDRPNPINATTVEGPTLDPNYRSFVGLHPIPVRHGKTIGQLAEQFKQEAFPNVELIVLPMKGYEPDMWFDDTGLPWVLPSPNMPTLDTAIVYPGMCLLEATQVSEARGTTRPFELFGAPYIHGKEFTHAMNELDLPGVFFREAYFQPTFHKFAGELCNGCQIHVLDRETYLPYQTGVEIIKKIREMYPRDFLWKEPPYEYEYQKLPIEVLLGGSVQNTFSNT